jgi:hypothetical protein
MTVFAETILKMMGWCPNVSTIEARKSVRFDDITANAPDSGGELTHTTAGWWNKYRNRILFNSFIITVISVYFLEARYDLESFIIGLSFWLMVTPATGIFEWHRLNKAASGEFRKVHITRRNMFANYLIIIGLIIAGILVIGILVVNNGIKFRNFYHILLGSFVVSWTQYLEVVYWEQKNRKILISDKTEFYTVDGSR